MTHRDFHLDLALVAPIFRNELKRFAEEGVPPNDRTLLAVVLGQFRYAIKAIGDGPNTLAAVIRFLEDHVPDFAWGSPEKVARWEHVKKQMNANIVTILAGTALLIGGMVCHTLCHHAHHLWC
jgi:hypothetical protein